MENKILINFQIRRHDDFPHQICLECMQRVRSAYQLKKQFERSHRKLLTYLESINKITVDIKPDRPNHKSIQTEDITFYPCEKCDDMFMNLQDLRVLLFIFLSQPLSRSLVTKHDSYRDIVKEHIKEQQTTVDSVPKSSIASEILKTILPCIIQIKSILFLMNVLFALESLLARNKYIST